MPSYGEMNGINSKIEECPVQTLKISSSLLLSRTGAGGTKVGRVLGPGVIKFWGPRENGDPGSPISR